MKLKTKLMVLLFFSAVAISMHSDAANWKMVRQGEEFTTGEAAVTEFVDIDSIQKTDKTIKKAWIRLFHEDGKNEQFLVLFTQNGLMRFVESDPPNLVSDFEWQTIESDSYWEQAYFEVWSEKERQVSTKKKTKGWKEKGKAAVKKATDHLKESIGL